VLQGYQVSIRTIVMSFANENDSDEVFVSGLPLDITEAEIAEYFGQIGVIKEVRATAL